MAWKFTGLSVDQLVLFKHASLDLQNPNLTIVRGLNRDSSVANSNGAGKSLLFNSIPTVFYDSPPTATRKKSSKDLFAEKGRIELGGSIGKDNFKLIKQNTGKQIKLEIERNEENLKFRTAHAAQEYLNKIFPISQELFYQLVYLRGSSANVLLGGTDTNRHAFFERIFHLETYDKVAKYLRDKLKEMQEKRIQLATIEEVNKEPPNVDKLKSDLKNTTTKVKKLEKIAKDLGKQTTTALLWERAVKIAPDKSIKEMKEKHDKYKKDLASLFEQNEKYHQNQLDWKAYTDYKKNKKFLTAKVEKYKGLEPNKIKTSRQKYISKLAEQEKIVRLIEKNPKKDHQQAAKLRLDIAILVWQLRRLNNSACPICAGPIDRQILKELSPKLEKKRKEYLDLWHRNLDDYNWVYSADLKENQAKLEQYKKNAKELEIQYDKLRRYEHYQQELDRLVPVEKPKEIIEQLTNGVAMEIEKKITKYKDYYEALQFLKDNPKPKDSAKNLQRKIHKINQKIDSLRLLQQEQSQKLGAAKEQANVYKKNSARIKDLKHDTVDFELYQALVDAYGPKGLRGHDVKQLVTLYLNNLNQLSSSIFNEPVKFHFELGNRTLKILADRNDRVYDICYLSGAERQAFNLLSLLSILPLVPEQYRTNLLILDEVDSAMSPQNRQLLATELLPRLQQLIPVIFVITPHSEKEFYIPNAKTIQIVRQNGKSKIKEI